MKTSILSQEGLLGLRLQPFSAYAAPNRSWSHRSLAIQRSLLSSDHSATLPYKKSQSISHPAWQPIKLESPVKRNRSSHVPIKSKGELHVPISGGGTSETLPYPRTETARALASGKVLFDSDGNCTLNPIVLRDACECSQCVDTSTRQREFLFTDIPNTIRASLDGVDADGSLRVTWEDDIPGYSNHVSKYSPAHVARLAKNDKPPIEKVLNVPPRSWDKASIATSLAKHQHASFMNDNITLARVLLALQRDGLAFLSEVPSEPNSVQGIVERIGPIRNTFYGMTWDVRSIVNANNVAYTSKKLGFHMDLLYMEHPPDFQFLHCINNSCAGGESRFVDTWKAAEIIEKSNPEYFNRLHNPQSHILFHYHNNGHHYQRKLRVVQIKNRPKTPRHRLRVAWSPPFMMGKDGDIDEKFLAAMKLFSDTLERDELVYETKMEEGTCVIFNNRRVCHARNAFDTSEGERWLKGAYLDESDFDSKMMDLSAEIEKLDLEEMQSGGHGSDSS